MVLFTITFENDSENYKFEGFKKFDDLINKLYTQIFDTEIVSHITDGNRHLPTPLCVHECCDYLSSKYLHTLVLKVKAIDVEEMSQFSNLYRNFCSIAEYGFEVSLIS